VFFLGGMAKGGGFRVSDFEGECWHKTVLLSNNCAVLSRGGKPGRRRARKIRKKGGEKVRQ
jgi:hypothetical protein